MSGGELGCAGGSGLGVYIHYPWCRSRCSYCDFAIAIAPLDQIRHRDYLDAVCEELAVRATEFAEKQLISVYLGGGTPSLWPAPYIAQAVAAVRRAFAGQPREVTLEANPIDCTADQLVSWRQAGIDRLSIGVQSLEQGGLVQLGRDHHMGEGLDAVARARAAGFERMSVDLILGAPGSNDPLAGVRQVAALAVPHLSVYELTLEPNTPLSARVSRGQVVIPDEDRVADWLIATHDILTEAGYEHYEVSSYALPGQRAIHNSLYWQGVEYLGLGSGAASFLAGPGGTGRRWTNHRSVGRYLACAPDQRVASEEQLSPRDLAADRVWLGLRTSDGIPASWLASSPALADWLLGPADLCRPDGGWIRPTLRGFLYSQHLMQRVLQEFRYP